MLWSLSVPLFSAHQECRRSTFILASTFKLYPEWRGDEDDPDESCPDIGTLLDWDRIPGRERFCAEADALGIPGVGIETRDLSPASGLVFNVTGSGHLDKLRNALRDKYLIVVAENDEYTSPTDLDHAKRLIAEARERKHLGH